MFKKLGLPMLAVIAMLAFMGASPALAGVHFRVGIGVAPVYPAPYVSPYTYSYPYGYYAPYPYNYYGPNYYYSTPYVYPYSHWGRHGHDWDRGYRHADHRDRHYEHGHGRRH